MKHKKDFRRTLKEVKRDIACALERAVAAKEIAVRQEFRSVLEQVVFHDAERVGVVTTNWECTIGRELAALQPNVPVQYLHGSCARPSEMYLPTEVVEEPYRKKRDRHLLVHRRRQVVADMDAVSKIVLYGLALSPLDAELGQILASAMNGRNVRRIHVVDPDYACVAERVAGLTDVSSGQAVQIVGCPPGELNLDWRYATGVARECR